MIASEFKYLRKEQLKKRVKIIGVAVYVGFAIAIASIIVFFTTSYEINWSWLLIALTYTLWPINLLQLRRRMLKEIQFREERLIKKQEASLLADA